MADIVTEANSKIVGAITNINMGKWVTWGIWGIVFIAIIGAIIYFLLIFPKKRQFKKKITACEIIGITFVPTIHDTAKVVKVGTSGFEILYLKKLKIFRIAYGGKVGKDAYMFFIMPDGYWYNGELSANMHMIDKFKGLIPVITTNPSMRTQYVALEKQIEALHGEKKTWMEKYGQWLAAAAFVLIAGVMLWLCWQEYAKAMASLATFNEQQAKILQSLANLAENIKNTGMGAGGLVPTTS